MGKERVHKADKRATKERKVALDKEAAKKAGEADAAAGKPSTSELKIRAEDKHLLNDFTGPKPKPTKPKGKYSGMDNPPIPPAPLLDLVHNFLKDFKYVTAAHGVRTDNQKRPGHNMDLWKWTSDGYPDLMGIFAQWQQQNPDRIKVLQNGDQVPKRTEDKLSKKDEKKSKKKAESSSEDSDSGSDSDENMSVDEPVNKTNGVKAEDGATGSLKRKASEMSSDSSSSSSDSASEGSSSSESSSESEKEATRAVKRRKFGETPKAAPAASKKSEVEISSSSDSDDDSTSESSPVKQDTEHVGATNQANPSGSVSDSESDSDDTSSFSSSSSSDSEDGGVPTTVTKPTPASKAAPAPKTASAKDKAPIEKTAPIKKPKPARESAPTKSGSDTSTTLGATTPAKAPYSTSGSSSASEQDTSAIFQMNPARLNNAAFNSNSTASGNTTENPTSEVLKFPSSDDPSTIVTIPATAANEKKLKKQAVPFSRIPDNVKVDERFGSNKYVSYDYADRAHQDLIVTKGKGFTKEKNKKKRGSYRGGAIDFAPKGIKFED